jgi:hypothetical protein
VALGVVDLFEIGLVGNALDPLLKRVASSSQGQRHGISNLLARCIVPILMRLTVIFDPYSVRPHRFGDTVGGPFSDRYGLSIGIAGSR